MALAYEHFQALREGKDIPAALNLEDAARVTNELISECRQLTMSQLPTSNAKQLCSILFSHEGGLISAFSTLKEPTVSRQSASRKKNINLLFIIVSLLLTIAVVYILWNSQAGDRFIYCLFVVAAEVFALLGYFIPQPKDSFQAAQLVDMDNLLSLVSRRMEAIDRDLDAFLSIPAEADSADDSMVQIITLANSLKRQDPDSVPDELMTAISALSLSKGYQFLEYNPENEAFFDTMPTKRETRTIVPAVIKEQTLVARGMAIVNIGAQAVAVMEGTN